MNDFVLCRCGRAIRLDRQRGPAGGNTLCYECWRAERLRRAVEQTIHAATSNALRAITDEPTPKPPDAP